MVDKQFSIVGVDSVYYALISQDDVDGYVAGTPTQLTQTMELKGATEISNETQWADNTAHDVASAEGNTVFDLIAPNIGEDVLAVLLGEVHDTPSGRIFDDADPTQSPYFALGYRFKKRNGSYRYRWYLKCRAEKPSEEAVSESDKVNLKPTTLKITAIKTAYQFDLLGDASKMRGVKRVHGDDDLANFDPSTWFAAVQQPVAGSPAAFTVGTVPADAATGVVVSANIVVTFSNELRGNAEQGVTLVDATSLAPVALVRTLDATRKIVTLNPSSNLDAATSYAIVIHDVVDIHGQALAATVNNFTTA